ncbi:hypothetical protein WCE02_20645 [Pseudomonas juntendi]|uniref:Uncharacterized protein n=1 Tax=Pseudomonas juntendi TaxID=2666183 RepID=A0ABZ2JD03_9PSED|nr:MULTISPECIES: hypothetical protein [Pseudomonas]MCF1253284.1 hypothetical protein [Pseudomonas putida]MCO7056433.1 hypothetical protein [Pseudomonas juntendi]MDV5386069.1 hypothetical protein [Pseudomonas juntendi]UJM14212.1 hypothetical protein L1P09_08490 [Pseudomonas juntendi]WPU59636.1 hypothetical protein SQW15_23575 [Pseudomonas asiatica]
MGKPPSSPSLHLLPVSLRCANAFGAPPPPPVGSRGEVRHRGRAARQRRHLRRGHRRPPGRPSPGRRLDPRSHQALHQRRTERLQQALRRRLEGGQGTGLHAADHLLLPEEGGASLRAAGWRLVGTRGGGAWSRPSRRRADTPEHLRGPKCLWQAPGGADKGKRPDAD